MHKLPPHLDDFRKTVVGLAGATVDHLAELFAP
jgi:hypothetical protein